MENKKIYLTTSVISLVLMIPGCIWSHCVLNMISSIGCSGIAASIMALYIEQNSEKKEKLRLADAKNLYFKELNNQLNMTLGQILWFDEKMNDSQFDWSLPIEQYCSLSYMIQAKAKDDCKISFEEAKARLKKVSEKYNLESQKKMTRDELFKVQKMFRIIANYSKDLLFEIEKVKENKLILDTVEYLEMDKTDDLLFNISLGIGSMPLPKKNYSLAINQLLSASELIREVGQYTDPICIDLRRSIQINEL